jgi:hypothetical protein
MDQFSKVVRSTVKPPNAGKGRVKGVPNKTTALLKDAILKAAQAAGGGGEDGIAEYLEIQAKANPGPFMSLLGKVLPMQVSGEDGGPVIVEIKRFAG